MSATTKGNIQNTVTRGQTPSLVGPATGTTTFQQYMAGAPPVKGPTDMKAYLDYLDGWKKLVAQTTPDVAGEYGQGVASTDPARTAAAIQASAENKDAKRNTSLMEKRRRLALAGGMGVFSRMRAKSGSMLGGIGSSPAGKSLIGL